MRRPQGYAVSIDPDSGAAFEADTTVCSHCQRITHVKPFMDAADMGGHCRVCDKAICARCVGKGCRPWEETMTRMERRERLYGDVRRMAGR